MKRTALYDKHVQIGAKMVEFAGFEMPVEYSGIVDEHLTVRRGVGVFDVSHMGEIWVEGPNALDFIQKISSNDAGKLIDGKAQYSCLPNGKGGIVDDILVYRINEIKYLIVVNASNIDKDWEWLKGQNSFGAVLTNSSDSISQLAIQGPIAIELLQKLTTESLDKIPYYSFVIGDIAGINDAIISNTGYTGSGGFELYVPNNRVTKLWETLFDEGEKYHIKPIGLGARDTLRLEMGYCLYGNDIDDTTSPLEAGLGWITKLSNDKELIDKKYLLKQKETGVQRKLCGFEMIDRGIPRHDYLILDNNDNVLGKVTSGTNSPLLQKGIGMGYISSEHAVLGNEIFISVRNKKLKAKIVKRPFI